MSVLGDQRVSRSDRWTQPGQRRWVNPRQVGPGQVVKGLLTEQPYGLFASKGFVADTARQADIVRPPRPVATMP
jgi:hypothetical protein